MQNPIGRRVAVLLGCALGVWCGYTALTAQAGNEARAKFDTATIKRHNSKEALGRAVSVLPGGRVEFHGLSARGVIFMAYASNTIVTPGQIVGGPAWLDSETFDIATKGEGDLFGPNGYTPRMISMLRAFVADRFKVTMAPAMRELPVHELVVATAGKLGPSLKPSAAGAAGGAALMEAGNRVDLGDPDPTRGVGYQRTVTVNGGVTTIDVRAKAVTMYELALHIALSPVRGPVIDRTGLTGKYDISALRYQQSRDPAPGAATATKGEPAAGLTKALEEQLGLSLRQTRSSVEVLVVEKAQRPALN